MESGDTESSHRLRRGTRAHNSNLLAHKLVVNSRPDSTMYLSGHWLLIYRECNRRERRQTAYRVAFDPGERPVDGQRSHRSRQRLPRDAREPRERRPLRGPRRARRPPDRRRLVFHLAARSSYGMHEDDPVRGGQRRRIRERRRTGASGRLRHRRLRVDVVGVDESFSRLDRPESGRKPPESAEDRRVAPAKAGRRGCRSIRWGCNPWATQPTSISSVIKPV